MQRWFQQSSAELSVALAVVILALALMTVASKWPTAVTGGDMFFGQLPPRQVRRMSPGVAERAPLLASMTRQPARAKRLGFIRNPAELAELAELG